MFGQLGLQLPAGIPSNGGAVSPGTGIGTGGIGTIGTGTGSCSVCGAATGLGNAASDLSVAAGQLGMLLTKCLMALVLTSLCLAETKADYYTSHFTLIN
ncbi:MAG: hypothetical protein ACRD8W_22605 [Nitrososphaeraceae archaeon]